MKIKLKNITALKLKLLLLSSLLFLLNSNILQASDTLYGQWDNHCYTIISNTNGLNWDGCNLIATQMKGYLATINSKAENDFLYNLIKDNLMFWKKINNEYFGSWLGGYQETGASEPNSGWSWITGENFDFSNWANGEPDEFNNETENRICFYGRGGPQAFWNDYSNTKKLNSFIIEINDVIDIDAGDDRIIEIGDTTMLGGNPTANGKNKPFEYYWSPKTNIENTNSPNPQVSPSHTTMYYLTVIPAYGCPVYDSVLVKVNSPDIFVNKPTFEPLICNNYAETQLEIKNIGTQDLNVKNIIINDSQNQFSLKQNFQIFSLKPDQTKNITITFQPKNIGISSAQITIQTNANPDSLLLLNIEARKDTLDIEPANDFIDLGILCLNNSKDTIFTIKNIGTVAAGGSIKTSKTIQVTNEEYFLLPNESKEFNLHFAGSNQGIDINTQIKIIDSICNIIKNIDVRVKIAEPEIYTDELFIVSTIGNPKESSLKVHNISDVDIFLNKPIVKDNHFQIINTQFPLKILKNGFNTIDIRFTPTDTNFIQLDLELFSYPCGASAIAQLYGSAVDVAATLKLPDISSPSNKIIEIPIYLIDTVNYKNSGYQNIDAEIKFNSTLLVPYGNTPQGRIENGFRIIPIHLPFLPVRDSTLKIYKFLVTNGNEERSVISLTNYKTIPDNNGVYLQALSGNFTLLGICKEGGERYFEDTGMLMLSQNYPNPADDFTIIKFSIIEKGKTKIDLYDLLGNKIRTIKNVDLEPGNYKFTINTSQLNSSLYFIVLKTLTQTKTKMMRVLH